MNRTHCWRCKKEFTEDNVFSELGWRETQISGLCEQCFDYVCADPDEQDKQEPEQGIFDLEFW